jgi:two-component system phosphate regulon response regulator PhoB
LTIALADDDPCMRQILAENLQLEGYGVIACASGAALLARARYERPPAAIVLDLVLRDMSGGRCLHALRESPWRRVPVMIFSGWERPERLGLEVQALVPKSAEPISIVRSIDRLIRVSRRDVPAPSMVAPAPGTPPSGSARALPSRRRRRSSRGA